MRNWLKKIRGSMVLEAALTIPIVFYMIFYTLELIRMNEIQIKLNAIAEECTMDYIMNHDSSNFDAIITKHEMQTEKQNNRLKYSMILYNSLADMMSADPYGGMDIIIDPTSNESDYLVTTGASATKPAATQVYKWSDSGTKFGKPFMLTFTYDFKFSSVFVAKLFNGGSNTKNGTAFLLWARGVGICE